MNSPYPNRRERPAARFEQAVETQAEVALDLLARSVRAGSVGGHEDRVTPIFVDWFTERGWAAETMSLAATAGEFTGRGAHTSRHWEGKDAFARLVHVYFLGPGKDGAP